MNRRNSSLPVPPAAARAYVRYTLAFTVSIAVGLAPLLGRVNVPGFVALFELMPVNVRDALVPVAAILMSIPAVAVQFFVTEHRAARTLRRWFVVCTAVALTSVLTLHILLVVFAVEVRFAGGEHVARYVVGKTMTEDCPCKPAGARIAGCIGKVLSFDPTPIEACYPPGEVALRKIIIVLAYLAFTLAFGGMIGLLVLREFGAKARVAHARAATGA